MEWGFLFDDWLHFSFLFFFFLILVLLGTFVRIALFLLGQHPTSLRGVVNALRLWERANNFSKTTYMLDLYISPFDPDGEK